MCSRIGQAETMHKAIRNRIKSVLQIPLVTSLFLAPALGLCQGYDDPFTEGINEGAIGSGHDDPYGTDSNDNSWNTGYDDPYGTDSNDNGWNTGYDDPYSTD